MNENLVTFLKEVMRRRHRLPSQLAADLGVCHTSVSRWLSGKGSPSFGSCLKLAAYASVPLDRILSMVGYLQPLPDTGPSEWPEFREYVKRKYSSELDDDLITMIEDLIERRRKKRERTP
ncbi:helix-turn-helix transcriptional regulator [Chloroflexota bacterium]